MSLLLNLVLTATLAGLMWTLTDAHPLEASTKSNGTTDVESTCSHLELLRGRDGMPGRDGREGRDGAKGEKGEIGSRGEKGEIGSRGEKGDRGEQGPSGPQGISGALGAQGPVGLPGPQGAVGEKGDHGLPGLQGPTGPKGERGAPDVTTGAIYTRWGKSSCPSVQGTELVYAGKVGGSRHGNTGGAANHLCMPNDPQYRTRGGGLHPGNYVYGAEYTIYNGQPMRSAGGQDAPCAICFASTRGSLLMIPARTSCPVGWTEEYEGYLMSGRQDSNSRTMYICVDRSPDSVPGEDHHDSNRLRLYMVEARCEGLRCPPYDQEIELTCVVCTR